MLPSRRFRYRILFSFNAIFLFFFHQDYGELRAEEIADTAVVAIIFPSHNRNVVAFPVQFVRAFENVQGTELDADITALAEIVVNPYQVGPPGDVFR